MTAVMAGPAAEIHDRFIAQVAHWPCADGWVWSSADCRRYHRAKQDGIPTLSLEYSVDDDVLQLYFVGVHGGGRLPR